MMENEKCMEIEKKKHCVAWHAEWNQTTEMNILYLAIFFLSHMGSK